MRASGALAVAAVAAACAATALAGAPRADEIRDCATRSETGRPARAAVLRHGFRLGPVTFGGAVAAASPGARTPGRDRPFVVKTPVLLPAGAKVVVAVPPGAASLAGFLRSGRPGLVPAVRFEACRADEPAWTYRGPVGPVTTFPFRFALARRSACVPVEVWVDGRAGPIRRVVPVGRRAC